MTKTKQEPGEEKPRQQTARTRQDLMDHIQHELRTPLNAIIGYSEMLIEDAKELGRDDFIPDLLKINSSGNQLLSLLNVTFESEKIGTDQTGLNLEAFGARLRQGLRPALNTVIGCSEMLMENPEGRGWKDFIPDFRNIHSAAKGFQTIINDIVNFSKIEAEVAGRNMETSDASSMVRDLTGTIHPLVEDDAISVATDRGSLLVVDDNEVNRDLLQRRLERQGYTVTVAENGRKALEILKADTVDLILLDILMPEMDGYEVCKRLKADDRTFDIPVIFLTAKTKTQEIVKGFEIGGVDYIPKPFQIEEVFARVRTHLELKRYRNLLEDLVKQRTVELEKRNLELEGTKEGLRRTNLALHDAMKNLHAIKITDGAYWLQIPEAELYILCGCPPDIVKLMMKKGLISVTKKNDISFETGPNAILLSDVLIQNGNFSNLAEFPVLQMLYRQGMILPNHPNNTELKPILIGAKEQVNSQKEYIYHGNYGLTTVDEIVETGVPHGLANEMMNLKMKFAFGKIRPTEELLDTRIIENEPVEIRNDVFVHRKGFNQYEFQYRGKSIVIDLNLKVYETYESPYPLSFHKIAREYFSVIHTGEGDGWDINRPCMASILIYLGKIYLIDAGPNILHTLRALSIDISEIEGVFHTHAHDDHFAGLPTLMQSDHRLKYYATPLIRASAAKKLSSLMSIDEDKFFEYFEVHDLQFDTWNDLDGLEVKPFFSPHPVEANIFLFRSLGENGYKSYAHWADIASFEALKNMVARKDSAAGISDGFYETVTSNLLLSADIKKVDIGGGLIHGNANDFQGDKSEKIILAHTSAALNEQQKEIGSERSFGTVDVLISANQNYLLKQAAQLLHAYFPTISFEQLRSLLNAPMVSFNPGSIIQKKGSMPSHIYFLLSGTAELIRSEFGIQNNLSNGCFIGDVSLLKNTPSRGTWRAVSYVNALQFTTSFYNAFFEKYGLYEPISSILDKIDFLQNTFLFGEGISYSVQNKIAQNMVLDTYENERIFVKDSSWLCLLKEGELCVKSLHGEIIETLKTGDFCGEESLFSKLKEEFIVQATKPSEVYLIKDYPLLEIPIVHWKFLEIFAKRTRILRHLNKYHFTK